MSKFQKTLVKTLFIGSAIAVMVLVVDFGQLVSLLSEISLLYFLIVVAIVIFDQAFMGAKWNILLHVFNVTVPCHAPILAYLRGRIFTFFAPSSLGIDAYKVYCVNKYQKGIAPIVSSIVVERVFGMISSFGIVLILLPFSIQFLNFEYSEYVVLISTAGFLSLCLILHLMQTHADKVLHIQFPAFFPRNAHALLEKFVVNLSKIKHGRWQVWMYFGLSIIEKSSYGLAVYFCARAIGLSEPGPLIIIAVAPIVALLERLPISVSAIGVREGLFILLFAPFYDDITIPLTISLILRAAELVQILIFLMTWYIGRDPKVIKGELDMIKSSSEELR